MHLLLVRNGLLGSIPFRDVNFVRKVLVSCSLRLSRFSPLSGLPVVPSPATVAVSAQQPNAELLATSALLQMAAASGKKCPGSSLGSKLVTFEHMVQREVQFPLIYPNRTLIPSVLFNSRLQRFCLISQNLFIWTTK